MLLGNLSGSGRRALARDRGAFCAFADVPREAREHLHRYCLHFAVHPVQNTASNCVRCQVLSAHTPVHVSTQSQRVCESHSPGAMRPAQRLAPFCWLIAWYELQHTQVPAGQGARARAAGRAHVPAGAHRLPAPPQGARREGRRLGRRLDRQRGMPWLYWPECRSLHTSCYSVLA